MKYQSDKAVPAILRDQDLPIMRLAKKHKRHTGKHKTCGTIEKTGKHAVLESHAPLKVNTRHTLGIEQNKLVRGSKEWNY